MLTASAVPTNKLRLLYIERTTEYQLIAGSRVYLFFYLLCLVAFSLSVSRCLRRLSLYMNN